MNLMDVDAGEVAERISNRTADAFAMVDADRMEFLNDQIARFCHCQVCNKRLRDHEATGLCAPCRTRGRTAARKLTLVMMRPAPKPTKAAPQPERLLPRVVAATAAPRASAAQRARQRRRS